jgi:hypothetical protein
MGKRIREEHTADSNRNPGGSNKTEIGTPPVSCGCGELWARGIATQQFVTGDENISIRSGTVFVFVE